VKHLGRPGRVVVVERPVVDLVDVRRFPFVFEVTQGGEQEVALLLQAGHVVGLLGRGLRCRLRRLPR